MRGALAIRVSCLVTAALILGCGGGGSSPTESTPRGDSLVLLSVNPPEGSRLKIGGEVHVDARFRYRFEQAAGGKISVLVLPLPFGLPLLTNPLLAQVAVQGPEGEASLSFDILLDDPDEPLRPGFIAADFPLFAQGQTQSTASVRVRYELVP
jgi:hypothetical protein